MLRKTVLLDCDGVLADFIGGVCDVIVEHGGPRYTPADVTEFDFTKSLGLDAALARKVKQTIGHDPGWWIGLDVFPGAIEGVARLREVAEVYIVTSPWNSCRTWLHDREAWLKRHFDIPHSHVIACGAKHLVSGDMLVDDKTETLHAWEYEHGSARDGRFVVQWQTPHNRRDEWTGRSTRSWSELLEWAS